MNQIVNVELKKKRLLFIALRIINKIYLSWS